MIIKVSRSDLVSKDSASDFASDIGADLIRFDGRNKSAELSFDYMHDGNNVLPYLGQNAQGLLEFEDGTVSKHYVRYERSFDED